MRDFNARGFCKLMLLSGMIMLISSLSLTAQLTTIKDYVLFGGSSTCATGYVQMGSSSDIQGGSIGSYKLVKTTGSASLNANIYSGGTVVLANSNQVTGKITAANTFAATGTILSVGSNANLGGNIDVNGKIVVSNGTVSGRVTHPVGTTYSGPVPGGGNITGPPALPGLPQMPAITSFPAYAQVADINSTRSILPGIYKDIKLTGNKTLTFNGPGVYVFNKITNSGGTNTFKLDFKNDPSATFIIYIHSDAKLDKIGVSMINGGSASRIFTEIHGTGSTASSGYCFDIANGSSSSSATKWLGTVWAPYGTINVGAGSGCSNITGALWSAIQVNVQCGAKIIYAPFISCSTPNANAGPDKELNFLATTRLAGSSTTTGAQFSWQAINGGTILSGVSTATPEVTTAGTYVLTVTTGSNCIARDTVIVRGKINNLIGSELNSLYNTHDVTSPLSKTIFLITNDSVLIDVIAIQGKYNELRTLLFTAPYGMRDTITNGPNSLIITGKFPIPNLRKLDSLPLLINHCRPVYPPLGNTGLIQTAGDSASRTNYVRDGFNVKGENIKVGVISDSYNTLAGNPAFNDITNGDLPGAGNPVNSTPVHVLKEYPFGRASDEGRAMLQIVHDIAPKAQLSFRTGFLTAGDFAQGIRELAADNCNIIVDDITYINQPFFKPGVVEAAINEVSAAGVHYVTAAGNFGSKSYSNIFNPIAPPAGLTGYAHNFGGGDFLQNDSIKGTLLVPGVYTLVLQWVDDIYSLGESTAGTLNDLDIYLANEDGTSLFGVNRNNLGKDPIEILPFTITSNTVTNFLIVNSSATSLTANPNLAIKYVVFRGELKINEYVMGSSTVVGHGNAEAAITVGAALYENTPAYGLTTPTIASFSSVGGTPVNNIVINKPDIIAPNGVNTSVSFGSVDYDGDGIPNFFGTSASAPHVAGAVALLLEAKKKFLNETTTPAAAKQLLISTSIDMNTGGFDFTTGNGFIQADAAVRTFANPRPQISQLEFVDPNLIPGAQPMQLIVRGNYLSAGTRIIFGTDTLPTTVTGTSQAITTIPVFYSDKLVSAYTAPRTTSLLDGGISNSISITGLPKKNITVIANNKTKKYAAGLPVFTSTILVDGDSLHHTLLTVEELGLTNILYQTPATALSTVGIYFIRPSRIFNPADPGDALLLEKYNYAFTDGALTIEKLPFKITPRDTTLIYGQKAGNFKFNYEYDPTVTISDPAALLNSIRADHESQFFGDITGLINRQAVTIVNGEAVPVVNGQAVTIVNGQAVTIVNGIAYPIVNRQAITIVNGSATLTPYDLSAAELGNLSFLATPVSLQNARQIITQALINGSYVPQTTNVIDITQESLLNFNVNAAQTSMLSSVSFANARGLADVTSLANKQAITIVNGEAIQISNNQAVTIVNGQAVTIVNGQAVTIVNGQAIPIVNSQDRTAVVVDEEDLGNDPSIFKSVNMITGLGAGIQSIIPGALTNDNLAISYGRGKLTILPTPISIKANNATKVYGQTLAVNSTAFTISSGILLNQDGIAGVTLTSTGAGPGGTGGTHPIIPSAAVGTAGTDLGNYAITYVNGTLTVSKAPVVVKANNASKVYGDPNPAFTASYTGLVNGQTFATSGIGGSPAFSTTATTNSCVGNYNIVVTNGSLSSTNYSFSFANGTLTITKASLNVRAVDKVIFKGDALPTFTAVYTTLKAGDNPGSTFTLSPSCSGAAGVYTIIPKLKSFANSINYTVTYTNGKLYINPKGSGAKKLVPYLECVEEVINPPSSARRYIAHFFCVNDNATPVYVPVGVDNKLSSTGSFDASQQPFIFNPGITRCNVPFDGTSLKWELKTYQSSVKTLASVTASSASTVCVNYVSGRSANNTNTKVKANPVEIPESNVSAYPNPGTDRVRIYLLNDVLNEKGNSLFDIYGRSYQVKISSRISANILELDISALPKGAYYLRLKVKDGFKTVSIIKG